MSHSFYAQLLDESFESLKSAAEPGQRSSAGAEIEIVSPNDPVLGKIIPVAEEVRSALVDAGYKVKGDDDESTTDGKKEKSSDESMEGSQHSPDAINAAMAAGHVPGEMNLIVNGVHMGDAVSTPQPKEVISIMTPQDVINPDASIHYVTDDPTGETKAYLSTEGYKVASSPAELIALLRA